MKRLFLVLPLLMILIEPNATFSQEELRDTANFPYWVEMMQDPKANFFQTQKAFEMYWKGRKIVKGSGWKVFRRWEYMMQNRVNPDGSRPVPDATMQA